MWYSRLFWKLYLVYVGLNLSLALGFLFVVRSSQRAETNRQVEQRLLDTAIVLRSHVGRLLADILDESVESARRTEGREELQSLIARLAQETETRLTVVDANGLVLADSGKPPEAILSHANRPELIAARETGKGLDTREGPTVGSDLYYLALRVDIDGGQHAFVRVAVRMDTINRRVASVHRFLWLFVLGFGAIATVLTYIIVGRISTPLADLTQWAQDITSGKDEAPVPVHGQDEVGVLAAACNQMQSELARRFRQLRENNKQLATILGSMDEGILAIDANENIVLANDASKSLLSIATDDETGRPLLEVVRSRTLHEVFQKCLAEGGPVHVEFEAMGEPRRDLTVRATCLPGDPAPGVVLVLHDISELRRLENLRREFMANVSHELKTPLASIKAYAETLRLGAINDTDNNLHFVSCIEEQSDRLHQLILDMLQIARVESGEEAFDITHVSVGKVVGACLLQHSETAERKHIKLVAASTDNSLTVRADEDGLRTILDNLVSNAIKYTPEGGQVTVRWRRDDTRATLEVQDTGIGIAEQHQTRIFERFYRADRARSRDLGGTGLGLSIVKHLCQAFGGSVKLISQPGAGSTFLVHLPVK